MENNVILQIKNLTKAYDGTVVLDNINLSVKQGERIALIGSSGSGKTTLIRCLNMLETADYGEILFEGEPFAIGKNINTMRQKIGMVFQNFNLFPHMTVLKNITLAPLLHRGKMHKKAIEEEAVKLLDKFGLAEKASAYPSELSGGQKQRVAIIRTLINDPKIILFDEPTSALDPEMIKEVLDVINLLADSGLTMILVTHEMKFAKNFAERVIFLDGKIIEEGSPAEIFESPKSQRLQEFLSKMLS